MTTAKQEFEAFLASQEIEGYKLGDITGTPEGDMLRYTELKISVSQEANKLKSFNDAREAAFQELNSKHDTERISLGQVWQGYENNNYTIKKKKP